ncbi:hypothetical protein RYX36_036431 [Vicia faba]
MCGMSTDTTQVVLLNVCTYKKKPDDDNKRVKWELNELVMSGTIENGRFGCGCLYMKKLKGPNSFPWRKEVYVVLEIEDSLFGCGAEGDGRGQLVIAAVMPVMGGSNGGLDLL